MSRRRSTWPTPSRTSGVDGQAGIGRGLDEDPVAEAVEVGDREAGADGGAERLLEPVGELLRRPSRCRSGRGSARAGAGRRTGRRGRPRRPRRGAPADRPRPGGGGPSPPPGGAPFVSRSRRTRSTMTRVLPVPAPAITTSGPSSQATMRRCSSVRPSACASGRRFAVGHRSSAGIRTGRPSARNSSPQVLQRWSGWPFQTRQPPSVTRRGRELAPRSSVIERRVSPRRIPATPGRTRSAAGSVAGLRRFGSRASRPPRSIRLRGSSRPTARRVDGRSAPRRGPEVTSRRGSRLAPRAVAAGRPEVVECPRRPPVAAQPVRAATGRGLPSVRAGR